MWHTIYLIFLILSPIFYIMKTQINEPGYWKFHFKFSVYYVLCSIVAGLACPFFLLRPRNVRNANFIVGCVSVIINKVLDIKWVLRNREILAEERGAVIISNHQSTLDILGMATIWHVVGKIVPVGKKMLLYVFPFGISAYLAGTVFIDRNSPKSAYRQLMKTADAMVEKKMKMWLFPEGTRNKDFTKLLPFKKGAFNVAVAAQVPIIPIVFSPYYFINSQKYIFTKGRMIIQPLEPISTIGLTAEDVPDLTAKVHEKMSAVYRELYKEVLNDFPEHYACTNKV